MDQWGYWSDEENSHLKKPPLKDRDISDQFFGPSIRVEKQRGCLGNIWGYLQIPKICNWPTQRKNVRSTIRQSIYGTEGPTCNIRGGLSQSNLYPGLQYFNSAQSEWSELSEWKLKLPRPAVLTGFVFPGLSTPLSHPYSYKPHHQKAVVSPVSPNRPSQAPGRPSEYFYEPSSPPSSLSGYAFSPEPEYISSWGIVSSSFDTFNSFDSFGPFDLFEDMENRLTVRPAEMSAVKAKAVEDARIMQAKVSDECKKTGKDPPPYALEELIGKGSFGRVYKGKDMKSAKVVAVKIIDIDESDTLNPRIADSYSEFLKEVNALKILSENKAKNINHVIEALPVSQAMWMITEYCGGGSVATLMKPTAPGGLNEKWIVPILREVAEAVKWVHQAGIIHRDIKCANVLVTEQGDVQLCDFGVAGIVESKLDKRSTIIGTPHWMAPELFTSSPSYGKEVDIWAFGAMVFEIATGLPPNVANGISYDRLGSHLQNHVPRLEGGDHSNNLRSLVAYCLEEDPKSRPAIEMVQKHPYILNTSSAFPTSSLRALVGSFKVWESRGGSRKSLFMQHGAQGPTPSFSPLDDEWNFHTTEFTEDLWHEFSLKDVIEAYGPSAAAGFDEDTTRPRQPKVSRRRPPPEALNRLPAAPLEKIFDPNTLSNYEDNARAHYGRQMMPPPSSDRSDLPLRDDSAQPEIKDTMIDLGGHDPETGLSSFPDMDTIKAGRRGRDEVEDDYSNTVHDFSRPALSDPAEVNNNRRTQDWKFPSMAPPASADPELSRFPISYDLPRPAVTPGSGGRPALVHHPTEPVGAFGGGLMGSGPSSERLSMRESLIDLDMGLPDPIPEFRRPSTANSDVGSTTSEQMTSGNPFELERHASLYQPIPADIGVREPSIYVSDDIAPPPRLRNGNALQDLADMSDFSASDVEGGHGGQVRGRAPTYDGSDDGYYSMYFGSQGSNTLQPRSQPQYDTDDPDYAAMPPPPFIPSQVPRAQPESGAWSTQNFPPLPPHPSSASLTGSASQEEMTVEITRMVAAMNSQLELFKDIYGSPDNVQKRGSGLRREIQDLGSTV